jgi:hypothetical protein
MKLPKLLGVTLSAAAAKPQTPADDALQMDSHPETWSPTCANIEQGPLV